MAINIRKFLEGIKLVPRTATTIDSKGELEVIDGTGKLQYHNGTTVSPIVTEAHSSVLTNKTIDADLNTITNIENADIKAGAAIDRTKLASGSNDHVIINSGAGVLSSEATLAKSRGGSGQDNSSLTFPASGTLATLAGTENLSGKTFTDAPLLKAGINIEDPGAGTNKVTIQAPTLAGDYTLTLPVDDGTSSQFLQTNGSGVLSWATGMTDPMTTIGDIVYRNGSNVTARLPIDTDGKVLTITAGLPTWETPSGGGGGGGGSGVDGAIRNLDEDEINALVVDGPNQFLDDFNTNKGTKTTTEAYASALRFIGSNLTGNYERSRQFSPELSSIVGAVVHDGQQLAPKNTALSPSNTSTSVTVKLQGDVTNMFANSKNVVIAKRLASGDTNADGRVTMNALMTSTNVVARLSISGAPSYSSGPDETTIVISNPDALDLSMGLSSTVFNTNLRIIPLDYTYQVKSKTAGSYESMDIDDLYARQDIILPGENFFVELGTLTGSILKQDGMMSPNKTYGLVRVLEKGAGNSTYHFFYTVNGGASWTKFSTTKSSANPESEEMSGTTNFAFLNGSQIVCADNGKAFCAYQYLNSSGSRGQKGVYSDLSAGSPALTDSAVTGTTNSNTLDPAVAGVIHSISASNFGAYVEADLVDLSYIAVLGTRSNDTAYISFFSNGGATFLGNGSAAYSATTATTHLVLMNGSGTSHRTTAILRSNSDGKLYQVYFDQGNFTALANSLINSSATNLLGASLSSGRATVFSTSGDTGALPLIISTGSNIGFGLTPSWASEIIAYPTGGSVTSDMYCGWSTTDRGNLWKYLKSKIVQKPTDEKHVVMTHDLIHPDSIRRSTLIEIPDVTAFNGIGISQFTDNYGGIHVRESATFSPPGQTFTATASTPKLRTYSVKMYQIGVVPTGSTIYCDLYATSGGLPTGAAIATSTNFYDPSLITKSSSAQWCHFNFNNVTLTNATVYAVVVRGNYTYSTSNSIIIKASSTSSYAGGDYVVYNGTSWSAVGGYDHCFMVSDAYITDVGKGIESGANRAAYGFHDQESQIQNINSTTAQLTYRPASTRSDSTKQLTGHPRRRVLTWGSSGTQSTLSSSVVAGYSPTNFDENLIFNVAPGYDDSKRQNTTTGVLDANFMLEDRSGMNMVSSSYNNITSADVVADASFQSGFALDLNGTDEYIEYFDREEFDLYWNKPFNIELEVKPTLGSGGHVFSQYDDLANYGFRIAINTNGSTSTVLQNSAGTFLASSPTAASSLLANTYYILRISYDGSGGQIRVYKRTSVNGAETELTYGSVTNFSSGNTSSTAPLRIGCRFAGGVIDTPYPGLVGYVKFSNGASTFNYLGYKSQSPIVGHQNLGTKILAENKVGTNSLTSGTNFDNAGIISGDVAQASMVDSNRLILTFSHTLSAGNIGNVGYFKLNAGRVSTRDVSSVQGIVMNFNK